jgi:PAS domain S-box-containing protein
MPSWIWRYGFAFLVIASTLILSILITPHFSFPGTLYLCAVMLSVWVGGVGPGLLASVLSTLAFCYQFRYPLIPTNKQMSSIIIVFLSNILIALMSAAQRSAKESLRLKSEDLKGTIEDLQRTNEMLHTESREREQAEKRLRRSEAYLTEAQRLTKTGSWAYDPTTKKAPYWSEEMFRIHGLEPQQGPPTSEEFLRHVHPEDRERVHDAMSNAVQEKREYEVEHRMILPNGTIKHVHALGHLVLNPSGSVAEVMGSAVDITERKLAEAALRRSEAYLAQAQQLSRTGSFGWDVSNGEIYWSPETFRIFELEPAGKVTVDLILQRAHPEDRIAVQQLIERIIQQRTTFDFEHRLLMPDGSVKYVHVVGRPSENASGLVEFVGAVTDVSERKLAEQERERFRQVEADLAHMNRVSMMGELAAGLTHEIKQPITAAITNANTSLRWLARDKPDLQEAREAIMRAANDSKRAAEIIHRLRSFYKKGAPPEPELVDLNEVAREMVILLRDEVNRNSISIHTDLSGDLPKITADRVQLQQVLMNLMLNGIEAMKGTGGVLTVKSQLDQDGRVLISVSDTGVGLPTEDADQIFNAFFTTKPQGSGMGLAISRSIVESHGGRLWATQNDVRGASFHFSLPTNTAAEAPTRAS